MKHSWGSVATFCTVLAVSFGGWRSSGAEATNPSTQPADTRTPIKHLIVENRSFDNVFGTYVSPNPRQEVWNLLSRGIVDREGRPGAEAATAMQQQASDTATYQLSPQQTGAFPVLPQPSTGLGALPVSLCEYSLIEILEKGNPAFQLFCSDIGLPLRDYGLLLEGGTGQKSFYDPQKKIYPGPDCRYPSDLPNGPYSLVGASVLNNCPNPYLKFEISPTRFQDNTGDPVHRFFQMWQQNDCNSTFASADNPSGCAHDLYTWVATSVGWQLTANKKLPTDDQGTFQGGVAMGFYNMAGGDYRYLRSLADTFAINDNYHQFIMGGTGPNSQSIFTADVSYFTDDDGNPAKPALRLIENPDPRPGSNNFYTHAGQWKEDRGNTSVGGLVKCADPEEHGVAAIRNYLNSLPYRPFNDGNCEADHYYQVDNEYPSYDHLGSPNVKDNEFPAGPDFALGPQTIPTIGDALSAKQISWKYYAEGFDLASAPPLSSHLYCAICNGFQYSRSIMTSSLKDNLVDLASFFRDAESSALPAVSFVKPDQLLDSHPGMSTPPLFEAFVRRVIEEAHRDPEVWKDTAVLVTFDESGGYYDSGYIQPIDFFGDGPRTVMIAVSPFSRHGFVDHTYSDHASIVKFIERNWRLNPLSPRSRDNLPNPTALPWAPYFPTNSPAIGDLMDMFDFRSPGQVDQRRILNENFKNLFNRNALLAVVSFGIVCQNCRSAGFAQELDAHGEQEAEQISESGVDPLPLDVRYKINALIADHMEAAHIVGLSLAVVKHGKPVYVKGFGVADILRRA